MRAERLTTTARMTGVSFSVSHAIEYPSGDRRAMLG